MIHDSVVHLNKVPRVITFKFEGNIKKRIYIDDKFTPFTMDYVDGRWGLYHDEYGLVYHQSHSSSVMGTFAALTEEILAVTQ